MTTKIKCILCSNEKVTFLDNYKFNVKSDIDYFGKIKIYRCNNCELGFCSPMPDENKLNEYYKYVYRSKGRPHEINFKNVDYNLLSLRNLNYFQYLTTFIDFKKIEKIFDFGSGTGEIGYLLKRKFPHLELYSSENDKYCKNLLNKRGYKNFSALNDIKEKFDLIISTHCLEHMTDLSIIEFFKKISNSKCFLFFEVPNCPLNIYDKRPYDSPHTIFFTKRSFYEIEKKFNLKTININYSSYSIEQSFKYMSNSMKKFEKWSLLNKMQINIKNFLKLFLPKILLDFKHFLFEKNTDKLEQFKLNDNSSWCLRCLFKINE